MKIYFHLLFAFGSPGNLLSKASQQSRRKVGPMGLAAQGMVARLRRGVGVPRNVDCMTKNDDGRRHPWLRTLIIAWDKMYEDRISSAHLFDARTNTTFRKQLLCIHLGSSDSTCFFATAS